MEVELITKKDLQDFRLQLLDDLKQLLQQGKDGPKIWLKNPDLQKLLSISPNTIQRLRVAGKLRSTKLGGVHYYRYEDIEGLMNEGIDKDEKK